MDCALLSVLRCAGCRSARLLCHDTRLECAECGRFFPVRDGVPVMLNDAVPARGPLLDPAVASAAMDRLGIPPGPIGMLRVRRASGARVEVPSGRPDCLRHDGRVLAAIPGALPPPVPAASAEGRLRCEWLAEYLPRAMLPGIESLANVQVRNAGQVVLPSAGEGRVTVACEWSSPAGGPVDAEDIRTALPADLLPGQVLTWPVRLRTPASPGRYTATLKLVQEGVRWLEPCYGPFWVEVHDKAAFVAPPHWVLDGAGPQDREGDLARATAMLRSWVDALGVDRPRILELGGGAVPVAARAGYQVVNVDGDLLALQLGRLVPGATAVPLCAGFSDLPLAEGAFDAIVSFGALRYAADPARTLRNLRGHLRPGGFIGLFCEPVGHIWPGAAPPALLADVRRGLNPQWFSVAEYAHIIRNARLRATQFTVDGASLKARLEPEADHA